MTKKEIDRVCIESRGEPKYWNITMFTVPLPGNSGEAPYYADLVEAAETMLRNTKGLGSEWYVRYAEVMAWSNNNNDRGVLIPGRFRVTLDMITRETEDRT